jgi:PadR family transcriptional regulator, regulatory protein PadR
MAQQKQNLLSGTLDLLILKTLSAAPLHGYGIAMSVKEWSRDVIQIDEGSASKSKASPSCSTPFSA